MAGYLITSLLSLITNLFPSITASAQDPSSSSSNSNNSERGHARAVEEDLERLMRTLERIKDTLYDADEREIRDRSVKRWLKELKKVAYDAEDVLSEYRYEVTRVQLEARKASETSGSHKGKKMEYIVPIPDGMVDQLKKIISLFDEIDKDRKALKLSESDGVRRRDNKILRPPTGHMVDEESIFGRDDDIKVVIDFLQSENKKSFSVLSIIGKGGLGKTTIAQLVYKDKKVTQCFDLFGWVCVSEEFDVGRLTKQIIESVSKINYTFSELSSLQEKLAEIVKGKKILLVLDDVWNEDQSHWELLRVPFKEAKLVKILVTTRNKKVADVMQTTTSIWPTNLHEDSCWQLFQHHAFGGTSDTMPPHLVKMGREIMRKCGGLPLAVKSIASLLGHETDEEGWKEILESDLWEIQESKEAIFPALEISYTHLPAHLKPCFLFCSMYPKDYLLEKEILIELWMSHGYIESRGKKRIREIGAEYYKELKERSFLDDISDQSSECCKLHDIIHDLARLKSENEHYSVDISQELGIQQIKILREAYHVYASNSIVYVKQNLPQNQGLRTLSTDQRGKAIWNLPKFKALRVLQLKGPHLKVIADSISQLKHLAYLSIISDLKMLPSSIGSLLNLQFLNIQSRNLLDYVPHGLVNFPAIKTMKASLRVKTIAWIKDLTDLEGNLSIFGVSNLQDAQRANMRNKCKLETLELSRSPDLHILDYPEKSWLKLFISPKACKDEWVGVDDVEFSWLDSLQPHSNIKKLEVRFYSSSIVPGWMRDPSSLQSIQEIWLQLFVNIQCLAFCNLHSTLKHLTISACNSIRVLQLEQLPSQLEELHISFCWHLEFITGVGDLDMLATLDICNCGVLKSITMDGLQLAESTEPIGDSSREKPLKDIQSLPFRNVHNTLKHLRISACDSIQVLQLEQLPSQLEELKISLCRNLELITGLGNLDMLATLKILGCNVLKSITMDELQLMEPTEPIGDSSRKKPLIGRQSIPSLKRLEIVDCELLHGLPNGLILSGPCYMRVRLRVKTIAWLNDMTEIEGNLFIYGVSNLKDAQRANLRNMHKLETLILCWDSVEDMPPYNLYWDPVRIYIVESELILSLEPEAWQDEWVGVGDADFSRLESLQPHPNLKKLRVRNYSSATLPGWMSDPCSLQSIQEISLDFLKNIQSLPFCNLHTLKHLYIGDCGSIRVLQLEQLPSQLEELKILSCRNLELITGLGNLDKLATLGIYICDVLKYITMDGLQLVEPTEPIGDSSKEKPLIGKQSISSLKRLEIKFCKLLRGMPNGLIPSGHSCYVEVKNCGCPDIKIGDLQ